MNQRRKFLGFLTLAVIAPRLTAHATQVAFQPLPRTDGRVRLLLDLIPDNPATRRLGRAAADLSTQSGFPDTAVERLFGDVQQDKSLSAERFRHHLAELRQAEFETGDTVSVKGWILARSEADATALAAIYRDA
jgi:hypothetical protein